MLVDLGQRNPEANLIELCYIMNDALNMCSNAGIEDKRALNCIIFSIKNILADLKVLLSSDQRKLDSTSVANLEKVAS